MKASELRAKDVAGLEKEVADLLEGPLRPAHAKGHATAQQPHARWAAPAATSPAPRPSLASRRRRPRNDAKQQVTSRGQAKPNEHAHRWSARSSATSAPRPSPCWSSVAPRTSSTARSSPSASKYHAHDENGEYKMGDLVEIAEDASDLRRPSRGS